MAVMEQVNLDILTNYGEVHSLSGHPRGLKAREHFNLDGLDQAQNAMIEIVIPDHVYGISPSFVQGFLTASVRKFGNDPNRFFQHYSFVASELAMRQIKRGMRAILTKRDNTTH